MFQLIRSVKVKFGEVEPLLKIINEVKDYVNNNFKNINYRVKVYVAGGPHQVDICVDSENLQILYDYMQWCRTNEVIQEKRKAAGLHIFEILNECITDER